MCNSEIKYSDMKHPTSQAQSKFWTILNENFRKTKNNASQGLIKMWKQDKIARTLFFNNFW